MIKLEKINFGYQNNIIFNDCNIFIPDKGFVSIFGQSGVGKTTLLKIIINQLEISNMEVIETIDRKEMFYVDQFATLHNSMKIVDHFKLISEVYCQKYDENKITEILKNIGLDYIDENDPVKILSVGERKRLSIAMAISVNPRLLIIDEPTSSIDYETKVSLLNLLKEISKDRCVLITSHETDFNNMFDIIYRIDNYKIVKENEFIIDKDSQQCSKKEVIPDLKHISKYKSKKDKQSLFVLFVIIVVILNVISFQQLSLVSTYKNIQNLTENMSDNSIYFVFESIDRDLLPTGYNLEGYEDSFGIINYETIKDISELDHVLEVKSCHQLKLTHYYSRYEDIDTLSSSVEISDSNGNVINKLTIDEESQEIAVVDLYENQNIYTDNVKLSGNYIDETTAEEFGLTGEDYDFPITITMEVGIPICNLYVDNDLVQYSYNDVYSDEYTSATSNTLYDKKEISIEINGIISDSDFTDYYYGECDGLIYVNENELNKIIQDNLSTDLREEAINLFDNEVVVDYVASNYIILVDSVDNLSDVNSKIEELDSKILTFSPYSYVDELISLRTNSLQNNILLYIIYAVVAIIIIMILLYRYYNEQGPKIILYYNLGISKEDIFRIFKYDIKRMLILSVFINIFVMIIQIYFSGMFYGLEIQNIFILLLVVTLLILLCVYFVNAFILKLFKRRKA